MPACSSILCARFWPLFFLLSCASSSSHSLIAGRAGSAGGQLSPAGFFIAVSGWFFIPFPCTCICVFSCTAHSDIFKFNSWGEMKKKTRQKRAPIWTGVSELNSKTAQNCLPWERDSRRREAEASRLQGHLCICCCCWLGWPCPGKWI